MSSEGRGVVTFAALPTAHRIDRAGMSASKQHQYSVLPPWFFKHTLERALDFHESRFTEVVRREVSVRGPNLTTLLIASDA